MNARLAINHSNTFLVLNKKQKYTQLIDALIIDVNQELVFIDSYFIQWYFSRLCIKCIRLRVNFNPKSYYM